MRSPYYLLLGVAKYHLNMTPNPRMDTMQAVTPMISPVHALHLHSLVCTSSEFCCHVCASMCQKVPLPYRCDSKVYSVPSLSRPLPAPSLALNLAQEAASRLVHLYCHLLSAGQLNWADRPATPIIAQVRGCLCYNDMWLKKSQLGREKEDPGLPENLLNALINQDLAEQRAPPAMEVSLICISSNMIMSQPSVRVPTTLLSSSLSLSYFL